MRRRLRSSRLVIVVLVVAGAGLALVPSAAAGSSLPVPGGFAVAEHEELAPGLARWRLERPDPPLVVHVARIEKGAPVRLRAVLSNDRVGPPTPTEERTSEVCRRKRCLVAVNGDFAVPETGQPVGGVIEARRLLRSPVRSHHQLSIDRDGALHAGVLEWHGRLVASDLREIALTGVNVERTDGALVLYTPAFGPTTATNPHGVEVTVRIVDPAPPLLLAQTALVEVVSSADGDGNAAIPPGGAVLSGHGPAAAALRGLLARIDAGTASPRALLRLETAANVRESIGGSPVLVREGRPWVRDDGSTFIAGRHPRTVAGWDRQGNTLLVTIDGRQPGYSVGADLLETASLLVGLGAVEAINLDGGGSTTFVVRSAVVNRPSDVLVRDGGDLRVLPVAGRGVSVVGRVERPVASALVVVAGEGEPSPAIDPLAGDLRLPRAVVASRSRFDPASDPAGSLPALVAYVEPRLPLEPVLLAVVLEVAALALLVRRITLRSRARPTPTAR